VTHTIRLRRVSDTNKTLVEFTSTYSRDAAPAVLLDSKFKKIEFFRALKAVTESRAAEFVKALDFSGFAKVALGEANTSWDAVDDKKSGLERAGLEKVVESFLKRFGTADGALVRAVAEVFAKAESKSSKSSAAPAPAAAGAAAAAAAPSKSDRLARGVADRLQRSGPSLSIDLIGRLNVARDGRVNKADFMSVFPTWFERKIIDYLPGAYF